jgi:hypothetical protein
MELCVISHAVLTVKETFTVITCTARRKQELVLMGVLQGIMVACAI